MKRKMLTICLAVFLLPLAVGYSSEKADGISVVENAFQLRMDGKSQQAKAVLSEYLTEHPDDAVAQYEYSRALCYLIDIESAQKYAALAVQLDEDNPRYHCWQGVCETYLFIDQAHHKDNPDASISKRATASFLKATELKPDYHEARFMLVNLFNNNPPEYGGDRKQAVKQTEYLMEHDLDYGLHAMMVIEKEKSSDWKIEQYQNTLAKDPANAGLHSGIARLYVKSGQMEKAQEHIDKAIELEKHQMDVLLDVIYPLVKNKDYETAKSLVRRYLELAVDEPVAMRAFGTFYLAKLEKMSGDPNADKTLDQARQIDPDVWMTMKAPPRVLFEPLE